MVDRGLLYREWKQNQVVILLSIVFLVLANRLPHRQLDSN
ncbi:putative ABC transporter permease YtrC [Bacillus subtilis]|nr:putative ABC transporter permease YtrC [Bacillus subtilis]